MSRVTRKSKTETAVKVWLCIEPSADGPRISNLPGGPNHCYITGKPIHYPSCGWYRLLKAES